MNTIQLELLELVAAVKKFQDAYLPQGCSLHVDLTDDAATIGVHGCANHSIGLQVKRLIGAEDAEKASFDPSSPWHVLQGKLTPKVSFNIFCKGLPPMCRIEQYDEEIPKEKVIQTGEKTVVKRTRICCGEQVRAQ